MFNVDVFTISVASDIRECVRESVCVLCEWQTGFCHVSIFMCASTARGEKARYTRHKHSVDHVHIAVLCCTHVCSVG